VIKNDKITAQIKHEPPYHDQTQIKNAVTQLVDWVNNAPDLAIIKIALFHHYYVYIHPFIDGNGRTVRLLTVLLFLIHNYQINKYFVLDDYYDLDRQGYSDALHSADQGNSTAWLEYFTDGIKYSLQSALARAKNALSTLKIDNRPTPREKEVLALFSSHQAEIITSDVVNVLQVSRQQAQNLLKGLVNKGLLEKLGLTKHSYYKLK
jgi:Fic family protein